MSDIWDFLRWCGLPQVLGFRVIFISEFSGFVLWVWNLRLWYPKIESLKLETMNRSEGQKSGINLGCASSWALYLGFQDRISLAWSLSSEVRLGTPRDPPPHIRTKIASEPGAWTWILRDLHHKHLTRWAILLAPAWCQRLFKGSYFKERIWGVLTFCYVAGHVQKATLAWSWSEMPVDPELILLLFTPTFSWWLQHVQHHQTSACCVYKGMWCSEWLPVLFPTFGGPVPCLIIGKVTVKGPGKVCVFLPPIGARILVVGTGWGVPDSGQSR